MFGCRLLEVCGIFFALGVLPLQSLKTWPGEQPGGLTPLVSSWAAFCVLEQAKPAQWSIEGAFLGFTWCVPVTRAPQIPLLSNPTVST